MDFSDRVLISFFSLLHTYCSYNDTLINWNFKNVMFFPNIHLCVVLYVQKMSSRGGQSPLLWWHVDFWWWHKSYQMMSHNRIINQVSDLYSESWRWSCCERHTVTGGGGWSLWVRGCPPATGLKRSLYLSYISVINFFFLILNYFVTF